MEETKMRNWKQRNPAGVLLLVMMTGLPAGARNVVTDWTAIASTAIVKNGGKTPGASGVWFAYTSIAMYDAVNAITGEYRPFYYMGSGPQNASIEAAAVAAAHKVLVNYFPTQQSDLDSQFTASLAGIIADAQTKAAGVSVGEAAAAALIAARANDGLEANVPYTPGTGPGVWQPTPPAFLPGQTPWLGQMRPFSMTTAADHRPAGPSSLDSEAWKRDYRLIHSLGGADSSLRSINEREIGLFWTEHTGQQYARMFSYLADAQKLSVKDTARLMAVLWTGFADAAIGCWDGKYKYNFWRPITAIAAGGANSELQPDSFWLILAATPAHPEYPSGHGCVTGAATTLISGFFGTTAVPLTADSLAFQDGVHTHNFATTGDLMDEIFWARMYTGFHYYHSMEDGRQLGITVARELLQNHFRPRRDEGIQ
jgi:hypothetical protein